jgi:hypothetical protein
LILKADEVLAKDRRRMTNEVVENIGESSFGEAHVG